MLLESKGKHIYLANQGNNDTSTATSQNGITGYVLVTGSSYSLTEMSGQPFTTGSGPQCIVEDPSNQFIYTANFNDSTVTGHWMDQNTGDLTPLQHATSTYSLTGPATWCLVDGRTS
jgi:DNA-binding beta-propeller fold protein YncE